MAQAVGLVGNGEVATADMDDHRPALGGRFRDCAVGLTTLAAARQRRGGEAVWIGRRGFGPCFHARGKMPPAGNHGK